MLDPIRTWYEDDDDERAEVRVTDLRDHNAEMKQLRREVERLRSAKMPTAQEMYWKIQDKIRELTAQGLPHLLALAMAFGTYIAEHPEAEEPLP